MFFLWFKGRYALPKKNEFDLAISGYGFFILKREDGTYVYTRNGNFHLSSDNAIVNDRGERLVTENQLNVPYTTDGMETGSESAVEQPLGCGTIFGCPPPITETRKIIIALDGSISLRNAETGKIFKFDRIPLAWIPPEQIEFSGYPISLKDQTSVSLFYPDDISQNASIDRNAVIQQGSLEDLSSGMKTWKGYSGDIIGNKARLALTPEPNDERSANKEITFDSSSTATIKFECLSDARLCAVIDALQDKQLIKVY